MSDFSVEPKREGVLRIPIAYFARALENKLVFDLPEMEFKRFYVDHAHDDLAVVVECDQFTHRSPMGAMPLYLVNFSEEDGKTVCRLNLGQ